MKITSLLFVSVMSAALLIQPVRAASLDDFVTLDTGQRMQDCAKLNETDKTRCDQYVDLSIRVAIARVLDARYQGEEAMKLSDIVARGRLAEKLRKDGVVKLSPEEITMIKSLLPKSGQSVRFILQLCTAVDPDCS